MTRDPVTTTMQYSLVAAIAVSMLVLGGCRERRYGQYLHPRDTVSLSAGDAVAHNKVVHAIDPWPAHSRRANHLSDGKRILLGMERYQKNESLEPQGMETSDTYGNEGQPPAAPPQAP